VILKTAPKTAYYIVYFEVLHPAENINDREEKPEHKSLRDFGTFFKCFNKAAKILILF
jgi:hypothetical protein